MSFALFASSSVFASAAAGSSAAYRAECTPGAPPSASTSSPESSAMTTLPARYWLYASAFLRALASKVAPSSATWGSEAKFGRGTISIPYRDAAPAKSRILPGFDVATKTCFIVLLFCWTAKQNWILILAHADPGHIRFWRSQRKPPENSILAICPDWHGCGLSRNSGLLGLRLRGGGLPSHAATAGQAHLRGRRLFVLLCRRCWRSRA